MRWVRTWPAEVPPGRNYVVDQIPRIEMDGDYLPVLRQVAATGDDTVLIEWDLAVSFEDRLRFSWACEAEPECVRVAPYLLYPMSTNLTDPVWAHRRAGRARPWITEADQECDLFGFGLVYLPHAVVAKYLATGPETTSDDLFSRWHHRAGLGPVQVCWDVRPVHLHY